MLQCYLVGGAVRDHLLGLNSSDRDWVVVGATPAQMIEAGFIPVGRDFPVFLHPDTKEEYALARTERKTAPGYRGFAIHADPTVTLEQDLSRRDLTVNAMALDSGGRLVDPFGGQNDLRSRVLRHVSAAFSEDPVRILRLARFAARFADFTVAPETLALARQMAEAGEVDALVPERLWQEVARGLLEHRPSRMLQVLHDCAALQRLMPELDLDRNSVSTQDDGSLSAANTHVLRALDLAAAMNASLPMRFACMVLGVDRSATGPAARPARASRSRIAPAPGLDELCERLGVPTDCRELAMLLAREQAAIRACMELEAPALLALLNRCDALRRPERFSEVLLASECDVRAGHHAGDAPFPQRKHLWDVVQWASDIDSAEVSEMALRRGLAGPAVGQAIEDARVRSIAAGLRRTAANAP